MNPSQSLKVAAFDGDDTLWHDLDSFIAVEQRFAEIVNRHAPNVLVAEELLKVERKNLDVFGFGVKGFILSLIETAMDLTAHTIPARDLQDILDMGVDMMQRPVEVMDGVHGVLKDLRADYKLLLVTKGDLFHQEAKIARSGLGEYFDGVEIVTRKDEATYRRICERHGVTPGEFVMVGNSLKSDVLPAINVGAFAVHIPYHTTWHAEQSSADLEHKDRAWRLDRIHNLPGLLRRLSISG